jgi:hypothetical protein
MCFLPAAVGSLLGAMSQTGLGLALAAAAPRVPVSLTKAAPLPPATCETEHLVIRPMTGCTATAKRHRLPPFSGHCAPRRLASGIRETTEDAL